MQIQGTSLRDLTPQPNLPSRVADGVTESGVHQRDSTDGRDRSLLKIFEETRPLPTRAPSGVDPEAWDLLNAEERTSLAEMKLPTELTYGRQGLMAARGGQALGVHLDVRV